MGRSVPVWCGSSACCAPCVHQVPLENAKSVKRFPAVFPVMCGAPTRGHLIGIWGLCFGYSRHPSYACVVCTYVSTRHTATSRSDSSETLSCVTARVRSSACGYRNICLSVLSHSSAGGMQFSCWPQGAFESPCIVPLTFLDVREIRLIIFCSHFVPAGSLTFGFLVF